jgi:hypothetical protein
VHARDLAKLLEERAQLALRRLKTHVTHKKILHLFLSRCTGTAAPERTRLRRSMIVTLPNRLKSVEGTHVK